MELVGIEFVVAVSAPSDLRRRFVWVEIEHDRAVVKGRDEKSVTLLVMDGRGNREPCLQPEFLPPEHFSVCWIERCNLRRRPNDELPCSTVLNDDWRTVTEILGVKRLPNHVATHFVEGHHAGAASSARDGDHFL